MYRKKQRRRTKERPTKSIGKMEMAGRRIRKRMEYDW
jgi:hypothetical protein